MELADLESRISKAADRALALELDLFDDLVNEVTGRTKEVALAADALARLDVAQGMARLALDRRYVRPRIDASLTFKVEGGRHPVVEAALEAQGEGAFVGNDCDLSGAEATDVSNERLWVLTGPNMAGKSTFLRQNALIAVMAQMGSFVPAGPGPYRCRRPTFLPRRRCRRPGPGGDQPLWWKWSRQRRS